MKTRILFLLIGIILFIAGCSNSPSSGISISDAWSRPAISGGTGGVFFVVNNPGSTADALRSASAEIAKSTEVHQTKMEGDVMKMSPVEMIPIPAQGKVELKPGSYHIMLIELKQELKVGDTFKVKVNFEKAGPTIIEVKVRQP